MRTKFLIEAMPVATRDNRRWPFLTACALPLVLLGALLPTISLTSVCQAGTLRTLDGRSYDGEIQFTDEGALLIKSGDSNTVVAITNVARATIASGPFLSSGSTLPNGWLTQDIGDARGSTRLDTNTFSIRVEGQSTNANACHFVARSMTSDGQITARVEAVSGTGYAQAGLMIRSQVHSAVYAAVSVGSDGRLLFQRRADPDRRETKTSQGPQVSPPVWLRLQKSEKSVAALWSQDGSRWQVLDSDTVKLSAEKTWREGEGEVSLLRASCGVFASCQGKGTASQARIVPLVMSMQGLLGEYFDGRDFRQLKMARVDPHIRFNWAGGAPDPSLNKDSFSVRWTGKIVAPKTSAYAFYFDAEETARLWINDREMPAASLRRGAKPTPEQMIPFTGGSTANIRMEFENGSGPASVRLGWGLAGNAPEPMSMTNFLCVFFATNSPESVALSRVTNNSPPIRGVLLRNGSFLAGTVSKATESAVHISLPDRKDVPILNSKVARIYLKAPQQTLPYEEVRGRSGIFMKGGDFFEGDFRSIEHGSVIASSVLYGLRRFSIEGGEPLVILLNDPSPTRSGWEVRLLNGTSLRASRLTPTAQSITVDDTVVGRVTVPTSELFEIRHVARTVAD